MAAFRAAAELADDPVSTLSGDLTGYLITPGGASGPLPTLLHLGGYDGTAEELCASAGAALAPGYAFAAVDGPGQGARLYDQRVPMRPDWDNVVPGMVNALIARSEVDPEHIVLVGRSFGGLLAPRGASNEPRLAAMVVDPGQFDMAAALSRPGDLADRLDHLTCPQMFRQGVDRSPPACSYHS